MPGKSRSVAFSHFEMPANATGRVKAKCKHCPSEISGPANSTSNFLAHIKRKHRNVYQGIITAKTYDGGTEQAGSVNQFIKTSTKYSSDDPRQTRITDALVFFVADKLLPLSTVDSPAFHHLMDTTDSQYQMPSRKYLSTTLLHKKSSRVKSDVKQLLQQAESVCLKIVMWSNCLTKSFIGITGHAIIDWTLHSVMVACKRVRGKHTGDNIREHYEEAIAWCDIAHKITNITTENVTKAFDSSLPGYEVPCQEEDSDEDSNSSDSELDGDGSDARAFECLPKHDCCYAHALQLVVKDGLKEVGQHLRSATTKASNIVSHVRKSTHMTDLLDGEKRLQAANATRWNSQLATIRSILSVPEDKLNQLDTAHLTSYECGLLKELCVILTPFESATHFVQQQNNVSASLVIPVTQGLKHQVSEMSEVYNNKIVQALKTSLNRRLSPYEDNDMYIMAATLDPRFKLRWCATEEQRSRIKSDLISKALHLVASDISEASHEPPKKATKLDTSFFCFMDSVPTQVTPQFPSAAETEVHRYLSQPCVNIETDILHYWKAQECNLPALAKLACKVLAMPASSVERLFSVEGEVFRPDRCHLKDHRFEQLMMIKCHGKLSKHTK